MAQNACVRYQSVCQLFCCPVLPRLTPPAQSVDIDPGSTSENQKVICSELLQIKHMSVYGVENPHPRSFLGARCTFYEEHQKQGLVANLMHPI